jgi:hypothetical protein
VAEPLGTRIVRVAQVRRDAAETAGANVGDRGVDRDVSSRGGS